MTINWQSKVISNENWSVNKTYNNKNVWYCWKLKIWWVNGLWFDLGFKAEPLFPRSRVSMKLTWCQLISFHYSWPKLNPLMKRMWYGWHPWLVSGRLQAAFSRTVSLPCFITVPNICSHLNFSLQMHTLSHPPTFSVISDNRLFPFVGIMHEISIRKLIIINTREVSLLVGWLN